MHIMRQIGMKRSKRAAQTALIKACIYVLFYSA